MPATFVNDAKKEVPDKMTGSLPTITANVKKTMKAVIEFIFVREKQKLQEGGGDKDVHKKK